METHSYMLLTAENKNSSTLYLLSKNINFLFELLIIQMSSVLKYELI